MKNHGSNCIIIFCLILPAIFGIVSKLLPLYTQCPLCEKGYRVQMRTRCSLQSAAIDESVCQRHRKRQGRMEAKVSSLYLTLSLDGPRNAWVLPDESERPSIQSGEQEGERVEWSGERRWKKEHLSNRPSLSSPVSESFSVTIRCPKSFTPNIVNHTTTNKPWIFHSCPKFPQISIFVYYYPILWHSFLFIVKRTFPLLSLLDGK